MYPERSRVIYMRKKCIAKCGEGGVADAALRCAVVAVVAGVAM